MSNFFKKLNCFNQSELSLSKAKYRGILEKLCLKYENLKDSYSMILEKCSEKIDGCLTFEEFKNIYPELRNEEKYSNDCVLHRIFKGILYALEILENKNS